MASPSINFLKSPEEISRPTPTTTFSSALTGDDAELQELLAASLELDECIATLHQSINLTVNHHSDLVFLLMEDVALLNLSPEVDLSHYCMEYPLDVYSHINECVYISESLSSTGKQLIFTTNLSNNRQTALEDFFSSPRFFKTIFFFTKSLSK
ncbi:hypothetical protein GEMRC1_005759 [Eukaryota sp. GEM-RC1]